MPPSDVQAPSAPLSLEFWLPALLLYVVAALFSVLVAACLMTSQLQPAREGRLSVFQIATSRFLGELAGASYSGERKTAYRGQDELDGFASHSMEQSWRELNLQRCLRSGSCLLHAFTWLIIVFRSVRGRYIPAVDHAVRVLDMFTLVVVLLLTAQNFLRRHPRASIYWFTVLFYFLYVLACTLPPFDLTCEALAENNALAVKEYVKSHPFVILEDVECQLHDCSLTGITATLLCLSWILLVPWLLPLYRLIYLLWVWIGVHCTWNLLYRHLNSAAGYPFDAGCICMRLAVLCFTIVVSTRRMYYLEKSWRNKFFDDQQVRRQSERMFRIFKFMVPPHLVVPMLQNPGAAIAETLDVVSIMFVCIADFDSFTSTQSPADLLSFLNELFTEMDQICSFMQVTKIETVGEEYVACVGAVPADVAENERKGHTTCLGRLICAADGILKLQQGHVRFKIGMHTGPVVAGVIGKKLPRYRLFGDTINTTARMMQKGVKGHLQFGEATRSLLPTFVKVKRRGEVEMKGKGMVMTYLFDGLHHVQSRSISPVPMSGPRRSITEEITQQQLTQLAFIRGFDQPLEPPVPDAGLSMGRRRRSSVSSLSSGVESNDSELFEQVVDNMDSAGEGFPSHYAYEPPSVEDLDARRRLEDDWCNWHHRHQFSHKFSIRLSRQLLVMVSGTLAEFVCLAVFLPMDLYRLLIFALYRADAIGIILFWRFIDRKWPEWVSGSMLEAELAMLLSTCAILVFYVFAFSVLSEALEEHDDETIVRVQTFLAIFTLMYHVLARFHDFRFWSSYVLVPLACGLVVMPGHYGLFLSGRGKALFVMNAALNAHLAYGNEKTSRSRFRAKCTFEEAQRRTEAVLNKLMPPLVLESLQKAPLAPLPSTQYEKATIAQSDLVGFTKLASTCTPTEIVDLVSELFGDFDELTDMYQIYKVETIGDAYIAGQAEPPLTVENKPVNVLLFATDMVRHVNSWAVRNSIDVKCRVGVHHGKCTGGIVGADMQRYHLFGELMTVLEILESTAPENCVQLSHAAFEVGMQSMKEEGVTHLSFEQRTEPKLYTSKGEMHDFADVGGPTFLICVPSFHGTYTWSSVGEQ